MTPTENPQGIAEGGKGRTNRQKKDRPEHTPRFLRSQYTISVYDLIPSHKTLTLPDGSTTVRKTINIMPRTASPSNAVKRQILARIETASEQVSATVTAAVNTAVGNLLDDVVADLQQNHGDSLELLFGDSASDTLKPIVAAAIRDAGNELYTPYKPARSTPEKDADGNTLNKDGSIRKKRGRKPANASGEVGDVPADATE